MTHTNRDVIYKDVCDRVLATDVALLNDHNVSDVVMSIIATEHAARTEALAKIIDPSLGRPLLVMIAGALLAAAKQIDEATIMLPELANV